MCKIYNSGSGSCMGSDSGDGGTRSGDRGSSSGIDYEINFY